MIIFCCGMIRSASTVQYQLVADIVESLGVGRRLGFYDKDNFNELMKQAHDDQVMYVVKCHWFYQEAGELIRNRKAKAIYIHRDVRDVVVSMTNHINRGFYRLIVGGLVKDIVSSHCSWIGTGNILVSRYEEMLSDRENEARKIAQYLGLNLGQDSVKMIAEKYGIEQQKARISTVDYNQMYKKFGRNNAPDAHSLLKKTHIRSGLIGQWRRNLNWFQISLLEGLAGSWLVENSYPITKNRVARLGASVIYFAFIRPAGKLYSFVRKSFKS